MSQAWTKCCDVAAQAVASELPASCLVAPPLPACALLCLHSLTCRAGYKAVSTLLPAPRLQLPPPPPLLAPTLPSPLPLHWCAGWLILRGGTVWHSLCVEQALWAALLLAVQPPCGAAAVPSPHSSHVLLLPIILCCAGLRQGSRCTSLLCDRHQHQSSPAGPDSQHRQRGGELAGVVLDMMSCGGGVHCGTLRCPVPAALPGLHDRHRASKDCLNSG